MNTKLRILLQRLQPWAFPVLAWLILSLMSMRCNYIISGGITLPLAAIDDGIGAVWLWWMIPPCYRQWWLTVPLSFSILLLANSCFCRFFHSAIPAEFIFTPDRAITQLDIYPTMLDVMGLAHSDYWPGMGLSALRPGLTPLTDAELQRRSVLSKRLLENDYFRQK